MMARIGTAVVGIAAVIALVTVGGLAFAAAVLVVAGLALHEYVRMMKTVAPVYMGPALAAVAVMIGAAALSLPLFLAAIFLSFVGLLFLILIIEQKEMASLLATVTGALYFGIGFGSFLYLRGGDDLLPAGTVSIHSGVFLLWFALIGTWSSDTFAYIVGKNWGRHKMAPHISPNKTMEGLAGGTIGCVGMSLLFASYFGCPLLPAFFLSMMTAIAAPMGDLFESYVKRVCDIKDSGTILPGHGGMMDRFDSLLFVAPLMLACLVVLRSLV